MKIDGLTLDEMKKLYIISAKAVAMYGDLYLPVFKRVHLEIEKINETQCIKDIALKMANK